MYKHLTQAQRYYIYVERQKGSTQKSIAEAIGVSESTVSREIRRNGGKNNSYNFMKAQERADSRSHRSPGNRAITDTLKWRVRELLTKEQWSPKQIAGRLKKEGCNISHETIYAMIRKDESGELVRNCRHKMKYDRRASRKHETKATNIKNRVSIHQRPAEADGTRFGDWEMDLIVDKDQNAILTLVERSTDRFLMEKLKHGKQAMCHTRGKDSRLSPRTTALSLPHMNGSQRSWEYPSTSLTHTPHGKKATSKTPTSSSGNIYRRERISAL